MPLVKVKPISHFPPGSVTEIEIDAMPYAICNIDGQIHCLDGVCPHAGGPLGQGALHESTLVCPWHGWEFDARTGACQIGDGDAVKTYAVTIQDDFVLVDLP